MEKKKTEFSKVLLIQESALIWIMSLAFVLLAFYCVSLGFMGSLPWLAAMVGCPWAAYAVSQTMYYKKALKENTAGGIKFETAVKEIEAMAMQIQDLSGIDTHVYDGNPEEFSYNDAEPVEYQI